MYRPRKPLLLAPAMNTGMWQHPSTEEHLHKLVCEWGCTLVPPVTKRLLCGELGEGALADVMNIVSATFDALSLHCDPF